MGCEGGAGARKVKLTLPFGDEDGGDGVAEEVGDGPGFGHEAIDRENEGDGLDGDLSREGGEGGGEGDEAAAGDGCGAFRGQEQDGEDSLLEVPRTIRNSSFK